jgi:hypothetical protein
MKKLNTAVWLKYKIKQSYISNNDERILSSLWISFQLVDKNKDHQGTSQTGAKDRTVEKLVEGEAMGLLE